MNSIGASGGFMYSLSYKLLSARSTSSGEIAKYQSKPYVSAYFLSEAASSCKSVSRLTSTRSFELPVKLSSFFTSFCCCTQFIHHSAMVSSSTTFPAKSFMEKVWPVRTSVILILNQSGKVVAVGVMAAVETTVAVGTKAATVGATEVDGVRGTAVLH